MITIFAIVLGFALVITAMRAFDRVAARRLVAARATAPLACNLD
jgi:hypothetical protein